MPPHRAIRRWQSCRAPACERYLPINRNVTVDILGRNASVGVNAYDLMVNTSDTGAVTAVDATDKTGGETSIGVAPTGASFRVINANTTNGTVPVATVTVHGVSKGGGNVVDVS